MHEIQASFDAHAHEYTQSAVMQKEIGERLLERLQYIQLKPLRILDLGCGTGFFTTELQRIYPEAVIIGYDLSRQMLKEVQNNNQAQNTQPILSIQGDLLQLPFLQGTFDLIFSNQVIHWTDDFSQVFEELYRVMAPQGCLMLTTLGPDTFKEIREAFEGVDNFSHTSVFRDMHDVGDILLQTQWQDPVVDTEFLTAQYRSVDRLLASLKSQGVRPIHEGRARGLMGKKRWQTFKDRMPQTLTYEVVYCHAWKGVQTRNPEQDTKETYVTISSIPKIADVLKNKRK